MSKECLPENEAVIYIPGLGNNQSDQTVEDVAYRLKKAIDINSLDPSHKFRVEVKKINYGKDNKLVSNVATIYQENDAPPPAAETTSNLTGKGFGKPILTVFELNYAEVLTARYKRLNLLSQTTILFFTIISKFHTFLGAIFKSKSALPARDKVQSLWVIIIYLIICVYAIMILASLGASVAQFYRNGIADEEAKPKTEIAKPAQREIVDSNVVQARPKQTTAIVKDPPLINFVNMLGDYLASFLNGISIFFTNVWYSITMFIFDYKEYIIASSAFILFFLPDFKNFISNTAIDYLCLIHYLNTGERRLNIIGKFEELLEYITESEKKYSKVNVLAYSFGSIVAIDALNPYGGNISTRVKSKVNRLITIGCPFDFIRVYWPNYFQGRDQNACNLNEWHNVCAIADILSSNFRNDDEKKSADCEFTIGGVMPQNIFYDLINIKEIKLLDFIFLIGLRAHRMYWDDEEYSASCYSSIVQAMYFKNDAPIDSLNSTMEELKQTIINAESKFQAKRSWKSKRRNWISRGFPKNKYVLNNN